MHVRRDHIIPLKLFPFVRYNFPPQFLSFPAPLLNPSSPKNGAKEKPFCRSSLRTQEAKASRILGCRLVYSAAIFPQMLFLIIFLKKSGLANWLSFCGADEGVEANQCIKIYLGINYFHSNFM